MPRPLGASLLLIEAMKKQPNRGLTFYATRVYGERTPATVNRLTVLASYMVRKGVIKRVTRGRYVALGD